MTNKSQAYQLYQTAKLFGQRPSTLVKVFDEWAAYCFDQAIKTLGIYIDNKLNERDKKGKQKYTLEQLLADPTDRADVAFNRAIAVALPGVAFHRVK